MNKRHVVLTAAVLSLGGVGLAATPAWAQAQTGTQAQQQQQQQPQQQQPAANSSNSAQTADQQQGASQASETDARQALSQIVNAALSKDGVQAISQQICQKSQQRLGDVSQQADQSKQLDQSVDQLKQAYKDKFQKDLDLSQDADNVFTAQFFQVGGIGDEARQASERQAPESNANPSNANEANKAADQTANANDPQKDSEKMMQRTIVTIPASHDLPEARIAMVKEGSQWKVALPRDEDAKDLGQKLQQHVQQAAQTKDKWPADPAEAQRAIAHEVLLAFAQPSASDTNSNAAGQPKANPQ